ncbi:hypothetical protein [Conexibacter sp. CPCC 206217]|uniref:hypothetical protein n=1 Tax=Conexibacter sp. CPCC 206217 TaxID=3064574 RepID=UPI00271F2943|nr:hypothetical protein [Conexibacter sp. CPCC 206217]MDO8213469.1 hypothetical protein [Conexibacter sp. CPCC 206217]
MKNAVAPERSPQADNAASVFQRVQAEARGGKPLREALPQVAAQMRLSTATAHGRYYQQRKRIRRSIEQGDEAAVTAALGKTLPEVVFDWMGDEFDLDEAVIAFSRLLRLSARRFAQRYYEWVPDMVIPSERAARLRELGFDLDQPIYMNDPTPRDEIKEHVIGSEPFRVITEDGFLFKVELHLERCRPDYLEGSVVRYYERSEDWRGERLITITKQPPLIRMHLAPAESRDWDVMQIHGSLPGDYYPVAVMRLASTA